jgi:hypothetical protein
MSVTAVEAHGEPQRETRFNRDYKDAFYLDDTGKLVFGHPGSVIGAEKWFNKALLM